MIAVSAEKAVLGNTERAIWSVTLSWLQLAGVKACVVRPNPLQAPFESKGIPRCLWACWKHACGAFLWLYTFYVVGVGVPLRARIVLEMVHLDG